MAKLPTSIGVNTTPRPVRGVARGPSNAGGAQRSLAEQSRRTAAAGRAITRGALSFLDERERRQRNRTAQEVARAKSAFLTEKVNADGAFDDDNDFDTFEQRYTDRLTTARDKAMGMIRDDEARELFKSQMSPSFAQGVIGIRRKAFAREKDIQRASIGETLLTNREAAMIAPDEETRMDIIEATAAEIRIAIDSGYYTEQEGVALREKWTRDYAKNFIESRPARERLELLKSGTGVATFLPTDVRVDLRRRAEAEINEGNQIARARLEDLKRGDLASRAATGQGAADDIEDRIRATATSPERAEFDVEQYRQQKRAAETVHEASVGLRGVPLSEGNAIVAQFRPQAGDPNFDDKAKLFGVIQQEWQRQIKLREVDPATAAMQLPQVQALFATLQDEQTGDPDFDPSAEFVSGLSQRMEVQRQMGIVEPRLLQRDVARSMAAKIDAASREEFEVLRTQIENSYGPLAQQVFGELGQKKFGNLDPRLGAAFGIDDNPTLQREYLTAIRSGDDIKKGMAPGEFNDIKGKVRDRLAPFLKAATAGGLVGNRFTSLDQIASGITLLAAQRFRLGKSVDNAAKSAVDDLVNDRFHLGDTWLMPLTINGQTVDPDKVELALEQAASASAITAFNPSPFRSLGVDPGDGARKQAVVTAMQEGFWVTNDAQTGVFRAFRGLDGSFVVPLDEQGRRYEIDFLSSTRRIEDVAPTVNRLQDLRLGP